ncbi:MAG: acyl-ACP--UDP-N-acetylglucosamine O-acyltransferase [Ahrensia sp.]|nr:acyl-ACP--UDP-N-acetylglucosamine O-acyltransferase [Ahrensia sp.]
MSSDAVIHPTSVVEQGASLGAGVRVGPLCHIGAQVRLGDNVEVLGQASIQGNTEIGAGSRVFPFASIGNEPQDLKFEGEKCSLLIGENCLIREGVTMNPGTKGGGGITVVGNNCALLANSHVAHDCQLGSGVILSNNVMIAGHCTIGDHVIFGGGSAIHQFSRVGNNAFIGGLAGVEGDVIPFGMAIGNRAHLAGLNLIGMKRAGVERASIHAARSAYKALFEGSRPVQDAAADLRAAESDPMVVNILDFVLASADRALCTPD